MEAQPESGAVTKEDQLETICKELGLELQKEKELYAEKEDSGIDSGDYIILRELEAHKLGTDMVNNELLAFILCNIIYQFQLDLIL